MKPVLTYLHTNWILLCILLLAIVIGLYNLDGLPAEMWGDATAHYDLAQKVQTGHFFLDYAYGGDGPLFTYIVVTVAAFLGLSFYTLKLTSVLIYLFFILTVYLLSHALFKRRDIAYISSFLAAVSFWSITFARQPHARMLVPLFITLTVYFAVKKKHVVAGMFLGLSMYTQASIWALPLLFWRRFKILLIGLLLTIPLIYTFSHSSTGFFTDQSYFGEKLATSTHMPFDLVLQTIWQNIGSNFLSFFWRGDVGFRMNVPNSPHLDGASACFFAVGLLLLGYTVFKEKKWQYLEYLILPFFLIQIPSLLDIHNPTAQPNIGRMIGVIPFVYIITAYGLVTGLQWFFTFVLKHSKLKKDLHIICLLYLLAVIAFANCYKYFVVYPHFLPDRNTPFARIIARAIDTAPHSTSFVILGGGWGEWQQPEQTAIAASITNPHAVTYLPGFTTARDLCPLLEKPTGQTLIVVDPRNRKLATGLKKCNITPQEYFLHANGYHVARMFLVAKKN